MMNSHIDYSIALSSVAKAQAKAILSGGEGLQERLEFIFQNHLKCRPQDFIFAAAANQAMLKRHTNDTKPTTPGMYLKLLQGRYDADEKSDDWGGRRTVDRPSRLVSLYIRI